MKHNLVERVLVGILLVVAAGIVVHTPLTVWLGTIAPDYVLYIKAWKEVLMGAALVLLIIAASRRKLVPALMQDRLMQMALVYACIHFLLVGVFMGDPAQIGAGLLIDLRFVLYFVLVYGTLLLYPQYRRLMIMAFVWGAVVVLAFAAMQQFVLPRDALTHIGYNKSTISPYLLVDENPEFVRINSTLRGPNPLGAYAVIVLAILAAIAARGNLKKNDWWKLGVAALGTGIALGASYSRGALIGAAVAIVTVLFVSFTGVLRRRIIWGALAALVFTIGTIYVFRGNEFVANVILHDNPSTGATIDSNTAHVDSLVNGIGLVMSKPFGSGIGSTGSASLNGSEPLIIENQYLFVAHEVGWVGLLLFVWLFVEIAKRLLLDKKSILSLGVFASGLGLATIGLFLPVWADDTVSIVWWGLAAVGIGSMELGIQKMTKGKKKYDS